MATSQNPGSEPVKTARFLRISFSEALGPDTVSSLAEQAGISDVDVLSGLSRDLPGAVDQFTPDGEIPRA